MEILKFNPIEMKQYIDEGTLISKSGFNGAVFKHGDRLIKLDKEYYHYLAVNPFIFANETFERLSRYIESFVEISQIQYLLDKQKDVHLTDFDRGVVYINDRVVGTILTPHLDYQDLTNISFNNVHDLLIIIKNILSAIRELELNGISHLDLALAEKWKQPTLNVLYKGTDIKLCDLSGDFISYKDKFNPKEMYRQYFVLVKVLIKRISEQFPMYKDLFTNFYMNVENYENALETNDKIEKIVLKK
jgi:hypothetical protein